MHISSLQIEGRGNGVKTNVVNNVDIAKALDRPPECECACLAHAMRRRPGCAEAAGCITVQPGLQAPVLRAGYMCPGALCCTSSGMHILSAVNGFTGSGSSTAAAATSDITDTVQWLPKHVCSVLQVQRCRSCWLQDSESVRIAAAPTVLLQCALLALLFEHAVWGPMLPGQVHTMSVHHVMPRATSAPQLVACPATAPGSAHTILQLPQVEVAPGACHAAAPC